MLPRYIRDGLETERFLLLRSIEFMHMPIIFNHRMRILGLTCLLVLSGLTGLLAQEATISADSIVDVVRLRDGSRLVGKIERWEFDRGISIRLITGALVSVPKREVRSVEQQTTLGQPLAAPARPGPFSREPKPYAFKEEGFYQVISGFMNPAATGGLGHNYAAGYRFNRLLGVGIGTGIETHDIVSIRNLIPLFVEVRGFVLPNKVSPYYAFKLGYAFALNDGTSGLERARGGISIGPEAGGRFGARRVNFFLGAEFKYQRASWTYAWGWDGQGEYTDDMRYRRLNLRAGIVF